MCVFPLIVNAIQFMRQNTSSENETQLSHKLYHIKSIQKAMQPSRMSHFFIVNKDKLKWRTF